MVIMTLIQQSCRNGAGRICLGRYISLPLMLPSKKLVIVFVNISFKCMKIYCTKLDIECFIISETRKKTILTWFTANPIVVYNHMLLALCWDTSCSEVIVEHVNLLGLVARFLYLHTCWRSPRNFSWFPVTSCLKFAVNFRFRVCKARCLLNILMAGLFICGCVVNIWPVPNDVGET